MIIFLDYVQPIVLVLFAYFNWWLKQARSKTQKSWKTQNFFSRPLNVTFRFWLYGKIENLEIKKLGIIFPSFPSFRFATFSFFKKRFFQYSLVGNSILSIYVMFCFQSLLKCFFFHQKYMLKIFPCCNEIYLLWDISALMRTWDGVS